MVNVRCNNGSCFTFTDLSTRHQSICCTHSIPAWIFFKTLATWINECDQTSMILIFWRSIYVYRSSKLSKCYIMLYYILINVNLKTIQMFGYTETYRPSPLETSCILPSNFRMQMCYIGPKASDQHLQCRSPSRFVWVCWFSWMMNFASSRWSNSSSSILSRVVHHTQPCVYGKPWSLVFFLAGAVGQKQDVLFPDLNHQDILQE